LDLKNFLLKIFLRQKKYQKSLNSAKTGSREMAGNYLVIKAFLTEVLENLLLLFLS